MELQLGCGAQAFSPSTQGQRQADHCELRGQSGLQSKFQDGQGHTEKPCLVKQKIKIKNKLKEDGNTGDKGKALENLNQLEYMKQKEAFVTLSKI